MTARTTALALCLVLSACSNTDPNAGAPIEQIKVRDPGAAAIPAASTAANPNLVESGKAVFAGCSGCHANAPGAANGVGPNLHAILGRKAGSQAGYAYSPAMAASGKVWTEDALDAFIADPAAAIAGTKMLAGSVADPAKRAALIAYLKATGS